MLYSMVKEQLRMNCTVINVKLQLSKLSLSSIVFFQFFSFSIYVILLQVYS